jgi:hypothetical protein
MALPQRRTPQPNQDWRAHYRIENPADVEAYVAEHPSVVPILNEAPEQIRAVFHNDLPPMIGLHWDPDDGDCWLFVGMPSDDVGPSVLRLIYDFEERWWLDRMRATDATVVFDVDDR